MGVLFDYGAASDDGKEELRTLNEKLRKMMQYHPTKYSVVEHLNVECYVINTGPVGTDDAADVGVEETVQILEGVARGSIDWDYDDTLGLTVPNVVPGIDIGQFSVPDRIADFEAAQTELRDERLTYLDQVDDLNDDIRDATD